MTSKQWLVAALGVLLALTICCAVLVGTGVYFAARQIHVERGVTEDDAEDQIAEVRRRFQGQTPLLDFEREGTPMRAELDARRRAYKGPPPRDLHVLAWDSSDERLVRLAIPFWLLKLSPSGSLTLREGSFSLERWQVSVEDLERAGPALVLDAEEGHAHILLWTE